jgi:hypothetical protein
MQQLGYHAATRQSWASAASMKELCLEIIRSHPSARKNEELLAKLFRERAENEREFLDAAVSYAVANTFNSLQRAVKNQAVARRTTEETQAAAKVLIATATQAILLNLEMPNGKRLRYCTGAEVGKFGAGYTKIAKKVGATNMVGSVLNEQEVRKLMG